MTQAHYDYVIIGSGFGGGVSALRLSEKGYKVLVVEKGLRFAREDFPKDNTDFARWYWAPKLGARGIFQMTFLDHVTIVHGVGVGGGSLVYACTLPTPADPFFASPSWSSLASWKAELAPHYETALRMLGATKTPTHSPADETLREIAADLGRAEHFDKPRVSVFFGQPGKEVPDPYFDGKGPSRVGCIACGACMTGCRYGAKNTVDMNYLYLAERLGCEVRPETEVLAVRESSPSGYRVEYKCSTADRDHGAVTADNVIFSGGVMGTVPLLLKMKEDPKGLPRLSPRVGDFVRTNSEALISISSRDESVDYSTGIAISAIVHTDEHSHVETVRYGAGSNFFQNKMLPHAAGATLGARVGATAGLLRKHWSKFRAMQTAPDMAKRSTILLYMRTLEGTLRFRLGRGLLTGFAKGLVSKMDESGAAPTAFMPEASDIAERFAEKVDGIAVTLASETLLGTPSTAHILGGACMGATAEQGVIDARHRVHGYEGLYVIDGAAVSANPGVNPSLTITALAERAMTFIPAKAANP